MKKINPWKIDTLSEEDYTMLADTYALDPLNVELREDPWFHRRHLIVGCENMDKWVTDAAENKPIALVSGFMTSGFLHLGSLAVLKQMAYYQQQYSAEIIIPIADIEAKIVRGTTEDEIRKILVNFVKHFIAAGLDMSKTTLYLQSKNIRVLQNAAEYTGDIDIPQLERIYDRKMTLAEAFSSLTMVADIVTPYEQGYENILVTLGIDEISHFVLTKEVIDILESKNKLAITYNKMITGLNGSKMGKSIPENSILLTDTEKLIEEKLRKLNNTQVPLQHNSAFNILEWYCQDDRIIEKIIEIDKSNPKKARSIAVKEAIIVATKLLNKHQASFEQNAKSAQRIIEELL